MAAFNPQAWLQDTVYQNTAPSTGFMADGSFTMPQYSATPNVGFQGTGTSGGFVMPQYTSARDPSSPLHDPYMNVSPQADVSGLLALGKIAQPQQPTAPTAPKLGQFSAGAADPSLSGSYNNYLGAIGQPLRSSMGLLSMPRTNLARSY